jgi:hypothetical protein
VEWVSATMDLADEQAQAAAIPWNIISPDIEPRRWWQRL